MLGHFGLTMPARNHAALRPHPPCQWQPGLGRQRPYALSSSLGRNHRNQCFNLTIVERNLTYLAFNCLVLVLKKSLTILNFNY